LSRDALHAAPAARGPVNARANLFAAPSARVMPGRAADSNDDSRLHAGRFFPSATFFYPPAMVPNYQKSLRDA
jgi:hypothetical protein